MPELILAPQSATPDLARARPNLWRIADPERFVRAPAAMPGRVIAITGGIAFAVAPGECFLRFNDTRSIPMPDDTVLITPCGDSHIEWRMSPKLMSAVLQAYGACAPVPRTPSTALALAIAGERMIIAVTPNGEGLLYHETALLDWFSRLIDRLDEEIIRG